MNTPFLSPLNNRRDFLKFMGRTAATLGVIPWWSQIGCSTTTQSKAFPPPPFNPLAHNTSDQLSLAEGLSYDVLIKWQDPINSKELFGTHNDFLAYIPLQGKKDQGILLVNHEYYDQVLFQNRSSETPRTLRDVQAAMKAVGNSLLHIQLQNGKWQVVKNSKYNRRISGETMIPFQKGYKIRGQQRAMGTLANCAGGQTPWGTFLSCEENYDEFYGDVTFKDDVVSESGRSFLPNKKYNWYEFFPQNPPEHYGWVTEIEPLTGRIVKRCALGRFEHEAAKVVIGKSGFPVVYMSEDRKFGFMYKFISNKKNSLESGTLYVADTVHGKWIPLDLEKTPVLKKNFSTQQDVLTYANRSANAAGGTQQDRPEDIEIDPVSGDIFVTFTNNVERNNRWGSIFRITEKNGDYESLEFQSQTWLPGSPQAGFACPDNLAFDKKGHLWMTTDMSAKDMNERTYGDIGNNGLYFIPLTGANAGIPYLVATAPRGAELTGPMFSPDYQTLFLSVQHPGEGSKSYSEPASCWPGKPGEQPKSSVVMISGSLLNRLQNS